MAQLVEWSLPTQEIRGLNPDIGKLLYRTFVSVNCIEKTKIKKKGWELLISKKVYHCLYS